MSWHATNSRKQAPAPVDLERILKDSRPRRVKIGDNTLFAWYSDSRDSWRGPVSGVLPRLLTERMQGSREAPAGNHGLWYNTMEEAREELKRAVEELKGSANERTDLA